MSDDVERLYQYGDRLNEAKDKFKNVKDYEGIISAARGSVKAKQLAAQLIPRFFKFFPDLAPQAVDAHFDLCEEDELGIRVQAIRGLPLLCKDNPEYVPKIVDVLGQLLTAEENVERDAVHKALMSLLRQDPKASLTALFKHIEGTDVPVTDESFHAQVLGYIRDKIFPIKADLLKPQAEMERHITDLVKNSLSNVTGAEFKMFLDFLNSLSLFGETASRERVQELIEIVEEQADLIEQFNISDGDHIDRLISCLHMALPYFKRGASNSKFLNYLNRHILSVVDKFPEERKLDLLKLLAESSPYTAPMDARQLLPAVVLLLKKFMPLRKAREEFNFTYVECLLYTFHQLAHKTPNATNSLCGYKIVTGQPSDRLGEDFSDNYKDFCERLTTNEEMARIAMEKLNQGLPELEKTLAAAKTEEDKASLKIQKLNTARGLRTCINILAMAQPLHSKSPSFIGDSKITLSWQPKPSVPSNTVAAGSSKRPASVVNTPSNAANKRARGEGVIRSQLLNRTLKEVFPGGRGVAGGRGLSGRGRSENAPVRNQFVSRSLRGFFRGGRGAGGRGRGQGGVKGKGYQ